jgi:acetyl/propionyl-CoA carboxylase alpha subunit
MKYVVTVNGEEIEVTLEGSVVRVGDLEADAHVADVEGTPVRMVTVDGRVYRVLVRRGSAVGKYVIHLGGFRFDVEAVDERTRAIRQLAGTAAAHAGLGPLVAPMPGLIVRVLAQPGDHVAAGQGLVVMEAMKMENELRAASAGIIKAVHVAAGDAVEKGAILVDLA